MKKRLLILMTVTGMIILLGGLLTYGLGVHEIIPVPRPDLIVVGTSLIGILLIVSGVCDLFVKKTKEMEIEENDERNISLSNAAMASGFKVMNVTIAVSIFALIFTGYMTVVPCFTIIGAYAMVYSTASGFLTGLRHHQLLQRLQRRVSHEIVRHKRTPL